MTKIIPEEYCAQIDAFLPDALRAALTSYQEYVTTPGKDAGNQFKDYHVSCRAAMAHIQLLVKLAEMTGDAGSGASEQAVREGVVMEAKREMVKMEHKEFC